MGLSDFLSSGPYDSRHYEYESSGSRMRRMDYGRMEHDVGSNPRAADHAYDIPTATATIRRPSLAQRLMRSSSHYEPESPVRSSRSHRSRKPSTINPTNYYGYADCIGKGNTYASGISARDRDRYSSPQRRRSSAAADRAWEAEQREREEAIGAAYGVKAVTSRAGRPSTAASSWTYDWGFDLSGGGWGSWASGGRGRSY